MQLGMVGKISYLPLYNLSVKVICDCQIDDVTSGTRDVDLLRAARVWVGYTITDLLILQSLLSELMRLVFAFHLS